MKVMKASKNFRNSKKGICSQVQFWGCWMYNSADRFFLGRWIDLAEVWKIVIWSRSFKRSVMMLSSEIDLKRQIHPKKNVGFLCVFPIVSHVCPMCFLCVSYVFPTSCTFFACSGAFCATPGAPSFTKLAIGYHKKWETYATAPRSTNYYFILFLVVLQDWKGTCFNIWRHSGDPGEEIFGQWCFIPWWLSRQ